MPLFHCPLCGSVQQATYVTNGTIRIDCPDCGAKCTIDTEPDEEGDEILVDV